jgi:hypothetical protein
LREGSPFVKHKEDGKSDTGKSRGVIPFQFLTEIQDRENRKHGQSDHFLNGLQLSRRKLIRSDTVCRDLKTVFEKSDTPTCEDDLPESLAAVFEMAIPGKGHEDIRDGEQQDGSHNYLRCDGA